MIFPFENTLILSDMKNAGEPQNDREFLISMKGDIRRLADSVDRLVQAVEYLEEQKIAAVEKRLAELEAWKQEIAGSWKTIVVICTTIATAIAIIVKTTFGK